MKIYFISSFFIVNFLTQVALADFSVDVSVEKAFEETEMNTLSKLKEGQTAEIPFFQPCIQDNGELALSKFNTVSEKTPSAGTFNSILVKMLPGKKVALEVVPGTETVYPNIETIHKVRDFKVEKRQKEKWEALQSYIPGFANAQKCTARQNDRFDQTSDLLSISSIEGKTSLKELIKQYKELKNAKKVEATPAPASGK